MTVASLPTVNWLRMPRGGRAGTDEDPAAGHPLRTVLDAAVRAGFRAVGLDIYSVGGGAGSSAAAAALSERHLACTEVGVLTIGDGCGPVRAEELGQLAREVGAALCVTVFGDVWPADAVGELRRCATILAASDVRLALEFVPYHSLQTLSAAIELCSAVGWERCALQLDSWHFFNSNEPWHLLSTLSGEQIALLQLSDSLPREGSDLRYEGRFRRALPGQGVSDIARFIRSVRSTGFDGVVSAEVLSAPLREQTPDAAARSLMASLVACWPDVQ